MSERPKRKTRVGVVVSDRRDRTISVQVATSYKHPRYTRWSERALCTTLTIRRTTPGWETPSGSWRLGRSPSRSAGV